MAKKIYELSDEEKEKAKELLDFMSKNKANINWYITTYDKTPSTPYLIRNFC